MKKFLLCAFMIVVNLFLLGGCSSVNDYLFEEEDTQFIEELTLIASSRMNYQSPLRLDVVVISNEKLAEHVSTLTARQYMKQRQQIKRDHPQEIHIRSFELIPGTSVVTPLNYLRKDVNSVFIFADFHNQKPNRWKVFGAECVDVEILENTLNIKSHQWKDRKVQAEKLPINDMIVLN